MSVDGHCVLVGTDGSWHSGPVLDVAAQEASNRGLPLLVVSVVRTVPDQARRRRESQRGNHDRDRELTDWRLLEAVSRVRGVHPALEIRTHLLPAAGLPWGVDGAKNRPEPDLLVVGARGSHDQPAFERGTVSRDLVRATACPVLVVPESARVRPANPATRPDAVVAAVADDALGPEVLRAAAEHAAATLAPLHVVHCYTTASGETDEEARSTAAAWCDRLVRALGVADMWGSLIPPHLVVTREDPARALTRLSATASMIVLGMHRLVVLAGLSSQSVSREVVGGSRCPVLLVPPGRGSLRSPVARVTRITP
ncbi:MAG TPA: universal stress protein [Actinomycetales bacterium]|nr:universal stress protein [Actinomycetales bacterium]